MLLWNPNTGGIFGQILSQFSSAEAEAFDKIVAYIQRLNPSSVIASDVAESVYQILQSEYGLMLTSEEFKDVILNNTESAYKALVKADGALARTNFNLSDDQAMQFLNNSDRLYLGKFALGSDLKGRITEYIREAYLKNGRAIGDSPKELNAFMKVFGEELDASKSQVRLIIDTTVSRARVFGQVNSLRAAGGQTYEITGPLDSKTCAECSEMVGRTFSVASAVSQLDQVLQAGPEGIDGAAPFLKGSLSVGDLKGMDDAELEAQGFMVPPFHPYCRHRLAVVSFYENTEDIPYPVE